MMNRTLCFLGFLTLAAPLVGCGDDPSAPDAALDTDADAPDATIDTDAGPPPGATRFAIEVSNDVPESIFVQLNREDGQPAWVVASLDGERVFFQERCEIEDCVNPSGVCGAAIPMVQDITGGDFTGSIELFWDGLTSEIDPDSGCERRVPAAPGAYVATFCFSLQATLEGPGDPTQGAPGQVVDPVCVQVPFTAFTDDDVVFGIFGG